MIDEDLFIWLNICNSFIDNMNIKMGQGNIFPSELSSPRDAILHICDWMLAKYESNKFIGFDLFNIKIKCWTLFEKSLSVQGL